MKKQTGFTMIEVLLTIVLLAFLTGIAMALLRPMSLLNKVEMFRIERDLNKIFMAIKRYEVAHEGRLESLEIPDDKKEICLENEDCTLKADISILLPTFLQSIPVNPRTSAQGRSGYYLYRDAQGDIFIEGEFTEGEFVMSKNGKILNSLPGSEIQLVGSWYGSNLWGQMGTGSQGSFEAIPLEAVGGIRDVGLSDRVSAYVTNDGELYTAGAALLGDGTLIRMTYGQVAGDWREVELGNNHALALANDGSLWGWGSNMYSQILPSGLSSYSTPALIDDSRQWQGIAVTDYGSLAWDINGELFSWGFSMRGALGQGGLSWITVPTRVGTATWRSLDVGAEFVVGIQGDGSLWSWGQNHSSGNLGYSVMGLSQNTPRLVDTGNWRLVSAGARHATGIQENGSLFTWGNNFSGQLGLGDSTSRIIPTQVAGVWTDVAAGDGYTLGIQSSGAVFAWGSNLHGAMTAPEAFFSSNVPWNTGIVSGENVEASARYSWVGQL